MEKIASILRFLQLYTHQAHNLISGDNFFQDHEFLGELYPAYESDYDDVIERMIGLGQQVNIMEINKSAANLLQEDSSITSGQIFEEILGVEKLLCERIAGEMASASEGTKQLIGDIANKSEMRQYKLKQRAKL